MAIEPIESTNTPNEGREIINDNFVDLDGRINEINPDGLSWHFGTGAPLDTVGFDGDMYFATNTGTYYGPKADGVWPSSGVVVSAVSDATETAKGKAEIATQAETDTGTDDTRIVTPLKLANYSGLGGGGSGTGNAIWDPVRVATTGNITLSGAQTIDGVSVVAGDRVLVMNQSTNTQNGIYVCASGAWSRATDANTSGEFVHGKMVFIGDEGTENGNQIGFFATTIDPFTLGSDPAVFLLAIDVATETQWGVAKTATQTEVNAGTAGTDLMVTPEKLAAWTGGSATPAASETTAGKAELATQTETNIGTDDARIVTPLKLASRTATDTRAGVVELATDTETQTGTDTARAITPANLSARTATETRSGVAEIATQTETDTGTDDVRMVTPLKAATRFLAKAGGTLTGFLTLHANPTSAMHAVTKQYADGLVAGGASPASETVAGIAEIATQTETNAGTDDTRIVTPLKLANYTGLSGGGGGLPWMNQTGSGAVFAAWRDGDPAEYAGMYNTLEAKSNVTASGITTSVARIVQFNLPKTLALSNVYLYGEAASTNVYKFAIYPVGSGTTRLWESGTVSPSTGAWLNITANMPVTITGGIDYWFCVAVASASATTSFRSPSSQAAGAFYNGGAAAPLGNAVGLGIPVYAQFAVTAGAFPSTLPTVAAAGYVSSTADSVPFAWLVGTAS